MALKLMSLDKLKIRNNNDPKGLTGKELSVEAKILAVADVVEAMASHRPYRPAIGRNQALKEIKLNEGILYDHEVAEACLRLFANGYIF